MNILLDRLPEEYEGFRINSSFRVGIQMQQAAADQDLTREERFQVCADLLFRDPDGEERELPDWQTAQDGIQWFLSGWYTDNRSSGEDGADEDEEKEDEPDLLMDYEHDQWRIYAAFLSQYRIDLNRQDLHYWAFMNLLMNLEDCAFRRVIEIRNTKETEKMSFEQRKNLRSQKRRFALEEVETEESAEARERAEAFERDFFGV